MKTVSFNCSDESVDLFAKILGQLKEVDGSRKIRIGGSEYSFIEGIDSIEDVYIDGTNYRYVDQDEFAKIRAQAIQAIPIPAPANVLVADDTNDTSDTDTDDSDSDNDSDEDDQTTNLSNDDSDAVRRELADFMRMTRIFTAFDITKIVRKRGVRCKHDDVKQIVHSVYMSGGMSGYNRDLVDMGRDIQPWLYCPDSRDPSEYNHGDN